MSKRLAESQLTQDNADQYLEEEGDTRKVGEVAAVFVGTYSIVFFLLGTSQSGHLSKANQDTISERT